MICQICGEKASQPQGLIIPVIIGEKVVLKRAIACGKCNRLLEEEVEKYLPLKQADIVTVFLKAQGVKVGDLQDYER